MQQEHPLNDLETNLQPECDVQRSLQRILKVVDGDQLQIDMSIAVPRNLTTLPADMLKRTCINTQKLLCMCRQYKASCGISSLCSVWNSLYSILGHGTLPPISQEEMMSVLGFKPPFDAIRWGPFTGNTTLFRWFHAINRHFGVSGKASYLYKVNGLGRTCGLDSTAAKMLTKAAIESPHCAIIYHCHNHYMVPLGFIESPVSPMDVFNPTLGEGALEMFLVIGEVSRGKHPPIHVKKWADVSTDIACANPFFFNIRQSEKGVQKRDGICKKPGGNLHCLLLFRSDVIEQNLEMFEARDVEETQDSSESSRSRTE